MTELYVALSGKIPDGLEPERLAGLAGLVVEGTCIHPEESAPLPAPVVALTGGGSEELTGWCDDPGPRRVVDRGLDECARLRDAWPALSVMPRLVVYKPEVVYRLSDYPGDGFKFYAPDTAAIRGYCVTDGDQPLGRALERAKALGFDTLWLHARDAAEAQRGLDLDLLERARRDFGEGLWVSGGAGEVRHLRNLAREGGVAAVVIGPALLEGASVADLTVALAPPAAPEVPIRFAPRKREGAGAG